MVTYISYTASKLLVWFPAGHRPYLKWPQRGGGSLFRFFRYFNVPYKMFPVKLEEKKYHYNVRNLSNTIKETFCKLYLMYTHQAQRKIRILQQEFFIFQKYDKKLN